MSQDVNPVLPDLFRFADGTRWSAAEDWPRRRDQLVSTLLKVEYGPLPSSPRTTRGELLHKTVIVPLDETPFRQYRIVTEDGAKSMSFRLELYGYDEPSPKPVIINGDGCWRYVTDEVIRMVTSRGFVLAVFNRTEIVPDIGPQSSELGLHKLYDQPFGSLAAWAWGYHRCIDFLTTLDGIDDKRVAVVGHSRGGKASLLAGATDQRVTLTGANNSGCGGAGCFRVLGEEAQDLQHILQHFPDWFTPALADYVGREHELPLDQHFLKAAVAPRALLTTEALGDPHANPTGTWHTFDQAREVYRVLGVEPRIGIHFRPGPHAHRLDDWRTFCDFADIQWHDARPAHSFNYCPFPDHRA